MPVYKKAGPATDASGEQDKASESKAPRVQLKAVGYAAGAAMLSPVQGLSGDLGGDPHGAAAHGISGGASPLPHLGAIQKSFGPVDVSGVQAHVGGPAATANAAMGSQGFATGNHVAFPSAPSLHTAAHEAAHVVQQRSGVSLKGGVGQAGDSYEQHADAVADRVVQGKSAVDLLAPYAGGKAAAAVPPSDGPIQKKDGDPPVLGGLDKLPGGKALGTVTVSVPDNVAFVVRLPKDKTEWSLSLYLEEGLISLWFHQPGDKEGRCLNAPMAEVFDGVRSFVGENYGESLARLSKAGEKLSWLKQRIKLDGDGTLVFYLGPSSKRSSQLIGFSIDQVIKEAADGNLANLIPVVARLETRGATLELNKKPKDGELGLPAGLDADNALGTLDVSGDVPPAILQLLGGELGNDKDEQTDLTVYWNGKKRVFGFSLAKKTSPQHALGAKLDIKSLQERFEAALKGLGDFVAKWVKKVRKKGSRWLNSAVPTLDGGLLKLDIGGQQLGVNIKNQLASLWSSAGLDLAGLIPDFFKFDFEGMGGLQLGGDQQGGLLKGPSLFSQMSFESLGGLPNLKIPDSVRKFMEGLSKGLTVDDMPDLFDLDFGFKAEGGLNLGFGISVDVPGVGMRHLLGQIDVKSLIERAKGLLDVAEKGGGQAGAKFVKWLRDLAEGAGDKLSSLGEYISLREPGILQIRDDKGSKIGFDLIRFLNGFNPGDVVPTELKYTGETADIAYGMTAGPDGAVVVQAPEGSPIMAPYKVTAPGYVSEALGLGSSKAKVLVSVYNDDGAEKATLYIEQVHAKKNDADKPKRALRMGLNYAGIKAAISKHGGEILDKVSAAGAKLPKIDSDWTVGYDAAASKSVGGLAFYAKKGEGEEPLTLQVGWKQEKLLYALEGLDALFPPDMVAAKNMFGGAISAQTGVPAPEGKPVAKFDADLPAGAREKLKLPTDALECRFYRKEQLVQLFVCTKGQPKGSEVGALLELHMGEIVEWARQSLGPSLEPLLQRFSTADGKISEATKRFAVDSSGVLRMYVGKGGSWKKHYVGFNLIEVFKVYATTGSVASVLPCEAKIDVEDVGRFELEGGRDKPVKLNPGAGPSLGSYDGAGAPDLLARLLRINPGDKVEIEAFWSGSKFGLTVVPVVAEGAKATTGIEAMIEVEKLSARLEQALGALGDKVKKWLAERRKKGGKSWLRKFKTPSFDGGLLKFGGNDGNAFGFRLGDQLATLFKGKGIDLGSVVPDFLKFDLGGLGAIGFDRPTFDPDKPGGGDDEGLLAGFSSIGKAWTGFPNGMMQYMRGLLPDIDPGKLPTSGILNALSKIDGGFQLGISVEIPAIPGLSGGRTFAAALKLKPVLDKALQLAKGAGKKGGKVVQQLEKWVAGAQDAVKGVGVKLSDDGILRVFDDKNQIGFDLKRFLDGFEVSDLVPTEIQFDGSLVDVKYGADMDMPAPWKGGDVVLAPRPSGGFELPGVEAPAVMREYFGAKKGALVTLSAGKKGGDDNDKGEYWIHAAYQGKALLVEISAAELAKMYKPWQERIAKAAPKQGSSSKLSIDSAYCMEIGGLGFKYSNIDPKAPDKKGVEIKVGYSAGRLIQAFQDIKVLAMPDEVKATFAPSGMQVGVGAAMPKPDWAKTPVLPDADIPETALTMLEMPKGTKADIYVDFEAGRGVSFYLAVGAGKTLDGHPVPGLFLTLPPKMLDRLTERLKDLIAKARKALAKGKKSGADKKKATKKLNVGVGLESSGVRITALADGRESWIEYGWAKLLGLLGGQMSPETLVPDQFQLEMKNLKLAKLTAKDAGKKEDAVADAKFGELPEFLQDALKVVGISSGTIGLHPIEGALIDNEGNVTAAVVHTPADKGATPTEYQIAISLQALIEALLPKGVAKRMNEKRAERKKTNKTRDGGFSINYKNKPPTVEVWYARKRRDGSEKFRISAGWTVAQLIEMLVNLDKIADDPGLATPQRMDAHLNGKDWGVILGVQQGWSGGLPGYTLEADSLDYIPGFTDGLSQAFGPERAAKATASLALPDEAQLKEDLKKALTENKNVEIGKLHLRIPGQAEDGSGDLVFKGGLSVNRHMALKLARLIPKIGLVVRILEVVYEVAQDPEKLEDLKHAPGAVWDVITSIPELAEAVQAIDWESVEPGKLFVNAMMMDLPSFEQFRAMMKVIKASDSHPLKDSIKGDDMYKAMQNADSAYAFAEALAEVDEATLKKFFEAAKAHAAKTGADPDMKRAIDEMVNFMDEYEKHEIAQMIEKAAEMGEAAFVGKKTEDAGGDGAQAMADAVRAQQAAKGGGGSEPGGGGGSGDSEEGFDPNDAIIEQGKALLQKEPYKSFVSSKKRGDETPNAHQVRVSEMARWAVTYGGMDVTGLAGALKVKRAEGADAAELAFIANLLYHKLGKSRKGKKIATPETIDKTLDSLIKQAEGQIASGEAKEAKEAKDKAFEDQAYDDGYDIDFDKANKNNPLYGQKYGYDSGDILGEGEEGIALDSSEFAYKVAKVQEEELGFGLGDTDGMVGKQTIKDVFEARGDTGSPLYQAAMEDIRAEAEGDAGGGLVGEGELTDDPDQGYKLYQDWAELNALLTYDDEDPWCPVKFDKEARKNLIDVMVEHGKKWWGLEDLFTTCKEVGEEGLVVTVHYVWTREDKSGKIVAREYESRNFLYHKKSKQLGAEVQSLLSSDEFSPFVRVESGVASIEPGEHSLRNVKVQITELATTEDIKESKAYGHLATFARIKMKVSPKSGEIRVAHSSGLLIVKEGEWSPELEQEGWPIPVSP